MEFNSIEDYEMNDLFNKFSSTGGTFMPKMNLKQPAFIYSACKPFTKNKERIQKLKKTGDTKYIYKNKLDKACFQHDMAYGDFRDLEIRTSSDNVLRDKSFNIAKIQNMIHIKNVLLLWFTIFFIKKPLQQVVLNMKLSKIKTLQMNFINQLLENIQKRNV